jgi:quinol monooxygenase YgiN
MIVMPASSCHAVAMITEIASLSIDPADAAAFEAAVAKAHPVFQSAKGCHSMALERIIEHPADYRLLINWDSVDAHMAFRDTPEFQIWRGLAGPFFVGTPKVVHSETIGKYF